MRDYVCMSLFPRLVEEVRMILIPALKTLRTAISAGSLLIFGVTFLAGQNLESPLTASVADVPNEGVHQNTAGEHLQQELKLAGDYLVGRGVVRDPPSRRIGTVKLRIKGILKRRMSLDTFISQALGCNAIRRRLRSGLGARWQGDRNLQS